MQIASLSHLDEPWHNIFHNLQNFLLSDPPLFLQEATKIPLIAELSNDEAVRGFTDNIIALQDIGMFDLGEGLDLAI